MNGNTITVVGNLTKDPILKYLPTGKAVLNFTVACNHRWRDQETQAWVDGEAAFFKIECWEMLAENISESLRKGDPVIVVGRMICRTYEQEGKMRESWELKAETIGPDLRRRAASLRRVLRTSQSPEPLSSDLAPADEDVERDVEDVEDVQDVEPLTVAPGLAVAS